MFAHCVLSLSSVLAPALPAPIADGALEVEMFLEVNETDVDAEVVFKINSADAMLLVAVIGPKGLVAFLNLIDPERLGQAKLLLESGEPSIDAVLHAYPEGTYKFYAFTVAREILSAQVQFGHELLDAPFFHPCDGSSVSPDEDLVIEWVARDGASAYIVEVENEEAGIELRVVLLPTTTSFRVPEELLLPDADYQIGVGVKTETGNFSVLEGHVFTDAEG